MTTTNLAKTNGIEFGPEHQSLLYISLIGTERVSAELFTHRAYNNGLKIEKCETTNIVELLKVITLHK